MAGPNPLATSPGPRLEGRAAARAGHTLAKDDFDRVAAVLDALAGRGCKR